jgi:putative DNA primase/helicase
MFSNHRPQIQGRDEGIWRRLRLVPWEVTIPDDEKDEQLAEKLKNEAPGILRWIVDGAQEFLANGCRPPDVVRVATARYRRAEDVVGRFVDEVLRIGKGWAWSADIRTELEEWCADQGVPVPRMNEIAEELESKGCTSERRRIGGKRGVCWSGVAILDSEVNQP